MNQEEGARRVRTADEIARDNQADGEHPLNPVMKTAATACELSGKAQAGPGASEEPPPRNAPTGSRRPGD